MGTVYPFRSFSAPSRPPVHNGQLVRTGLLLPDSEPLLSYGFHGVAVDLGPHYMLERCWKDFRFRPYSAWDTQLRS